jgi:hypothetical protein
MKKLLLLLALLPSLAFAGEDVRVSWTPVAGSPVSGYFIYYTDSLGTGHKVSVDDADAVQHVVPNVEYGPSQWAVSARCSFCSLKESAVSDSTPLDVVSKDDPQAPALNEVVIVNSPSASNIKFRAKVAGLKYRGDCKQKRRNDKLLVCRGDRIN